MHVVSFLADLYYSDQSLVFPLFSIFLSMIFILLVTFLAALLISDLLIQVLRVQGESRGEWQVLFQWRQTVVRIALLPAQDVLRLQQEHTKGRMGKFGLSLRTGGVEFGKFSN